MRCGFTAYFAFAVSLCASTPEPLNLAPRETYRELAGIRFRRLLFEDSRSRITYEPPVAWSYSSPSNHMLRLYPANVSLAEGSIESSLASIGGEATELVNFVPESSTGVEALDIPESPFRIAGQEPVEICGKFTFAAQTFMVGVLIVNLGENQLRCRFSAREADFPKLYALFRQSLCTWQITAVTKPPGQP